MYRHNTYGDNFAEVYDDWYHDIEVIDDCIEFLLQLAAGGTVLELGVGTGRVAIPLATRGAEFGLRVIGIDSSEAMLTRLESKQHQDARVQTVMGHMVRDMPHGPFGVVLLAYNTLFNLLGAEEQLECIRQAELRLAPGGHVVVDCFVPANQLPTFIEPYVQRTTLHGVVMNEATVLADQQRVDGVLTEVLDDGKRVARPWSIRYSSVAEIDAMAESAGLKCEQRWSNYGRGLFTDESSRHISVYGRR